MITRRAFVGGAAAVGAVSVLPAGSESFRSRVGLELYSLRREMAADIPGTLTKVRNLGFTDVEVPGYYGLMAEAFRKALERAGLKATALVTQWDTLDKDIGQARRDLEIMGATWAILPWIPHGDTFTPSDAEGAAQKMNAWGTALAKTGKRFAYHPHGYEFRPSPEGTLFDLLAGRTNSEVVCFEMDTFWIAWPGQDCVKLLDRYPKRFRLLHLKDLSKSAGPGNLSGTAPDMASVAVGDGVVPWKGVLAIAERQGCEGYYIEDESPEAAKQIPRSLDYLKQLEL